MDPSSQSGVWGFQGRLPGRMSAGRRGFGASMIDQNRMEDRRKGPGGIDEARLRQQAIGVKLRQMFDDVVNEPVPDEFLDILRKADKRSSENG